MESIVPPTPQKLPVDEPYRVEAIGPEDRRFQDVIELWGSERKTLGLFPVGAFETRAQAGHLLVASTHKGAVLGYIVYRLQRRLNCAAIIHLCVGPNLRGKNVSDALWEAMKKAAIAAGCDSVRLKCRRDFIHAKKLWRRLGFVARADVDGRSSRGSELTVWVYSFHAENLPLFATETEDDRLKAVIDANVFYDLHGMGGNRDEESKVLIEPWMDESVALCVVNELHNEIDRHAEREERDHLHRTAQHYREIHAPDGKTGPAYEKLIDILGEPGTNESKKSDRNQLAKASAGEADVFVTRDRQLLGKATEIERQLGLKVMTPAELSSTLDEAERAQVFQPVRLAGTNLIERAMRAEDVDVIVQTFQASLFGEKQGNCAQLIRQHLAQRRSIKPAQLRVVWGGGKAPLAASIRVVDPDRKYAGVSFLRFSQGGLEKTLCRHLLLALVRENNDDGLDELIINDPYLAPATVDALRELHFEHGTQGWRRMTPAMVGTRAELSKSLGDKAEVLALPTALLEERHWPAKVLGENLPSYILSIEPVWAAQLFDRGLAEEELFGVFAKLALNREQVYYRSARAAGLVFPARILWYVCQGKATNAGMSIRACSRLQSLETGSAKELFRKYQRLGIYSWHEIVATTGGDAHADIMAIRFADSEPFAQSVPVKVLRDLGIRSQFQSPTKITEDQFAAIYRFGMNR